MATDIQVIIQDESGQITVEADAINVVTVYDEQQIVVEDMSVQVVTVGEQGPAGPAGATGAGTSAMTLEAGENLAVGDPVWVNANRFYLADNVMNFRVVGVVTTAALAGLLATATTSGQITLSGLTANTPYFLGGGIITSAVPASGYVVRIGQAVNSTVLLLNLEEPILLA